MSKTAYLFPGQGAQYPGIGKDLHAKFEIVRATYAEAADALGYDIAALSFTGDAAQINLTRHTQPVLLTHSIACMRAYRSLRDDADDAMPMLAAGHSLGEYGALVAAESLAFADALQLVKTRGELMSAHGMGEMQALMLDAGAARELAAMHHCALAACNLPQQTVVGGRAEDLDALLTDMAARHPRKRSRRLKTEGAFHTFYMVEAALKFRASLEAAKFAKPKCAVLSNFSGGFHQPDAAAIRSQLFLQLFNPVLWHENLLQIAAADVNVLIEFGGGLDAPGGGDSPDDKRANLESMLKKVCAGESTHYAAVINTRTLAAAVAE